MSTFATLLGLEDTVYGWMMNTVRQAIDCGRNVGIRIRLSDSNTGVEQSSKHGLTYVRLPLWLFTSEKHSLKNVRKGFGRVQHALAAFQENDTT